MSSYLMYLEPNNLCGKIVLNGFKWIQNLSKFDKDFIKNYVKYSNKGYIRELDVEYTKTLHDLHCDLPFLPERTQINKCKKLVCNMYDKNNYVAHIKALKKV